MEDPQLQSAGAAGIPKLTHSSPPVPELIPLSVALPIMGIALWCVWAAYTTTEPPEVAASILISPKVVTDAVEPPEVVAHATVSPEAMAPAAVSPKVAAYAAEPPEATALASAPCVVVVPAMHFQPVMSRSKRKLLNSVSTLSRRMSMNSPTKLFRMRKSII